MRKAAYGGVALAVLVALSGCKDNSDDADDAVSLTDAEIAVVDGASVQAGPSGSVAQGGGGQDDDAGNAGGTDAGRVDGPPGGDGGAQGDGGAFDGGGLGIEAGVPTTPFGDAGSAGFPNGGDGGFPP